VRAGRRPRPVHPTALQLAYYRELRVLVKQLRALVKTRLSPMLAELHGRAHADTAPQPPARRASRILEGIRATADKLTDRRRLEKMVSSIAGATDASQKASLVSTLREELTIAPRELTAGIRPLVDRWVHENVALIQTVPGRYLDAVEREVHAGFRNSERAEDIEERLVEEGLATEARARVIARDQVSKLTADLNQQRQQNLGGESYTWRTSGDERVRPAHRERDGQVYSWDEPPGDPDDPSEGGHPGDAINCRCYAEFVLPEEG
jgi:SPP1 gp7 family putative phage head morphogenesis protein